ncbi:MAG: hypothetical protein K9L78_02580, partial [Victivallales bacterium]|nr:hypothetical protein [Victivallales bacterium]
NVETTKKLSEQNISRQLNYTEVKLLKATQSDPVLTKLSGVNYTSKYPNNNIDKGCRSFSKIEMDCNHGNILHKSDLLYEHITCFFE